MSPSSYTNTIFNQFFAWHTILWCLLWSITEQTYERKYCKITKRNHSFIPNIKISILFTIYLVCFCYEYRITWLGHVKSSIKFCSNSKKPEKKRIHVVRDGTLSKILTSIVLNKLQINVGFEKKRGFISKTRISRHRVLNLSWVIQTFKSVQSKSLM